jgi:hypothetical protein
MRNSFAFKGRPEVITHKLVKCFTRPPHLGVRAARTVLVWLVLNGEVLEGNPFISVRLCGARQIERVPK